MFQCCIPSLPVAPSTGSKPRLSELLGASTNYDFNDFLINYMCNTWPAFLQSVFFSKYDLKTTNR